jgi:hypothetical protein
MNLVYADVRLYCLRVLVTLITHLFEKYLANFLIIVPRLQTFCDCISECDVTLENDLPIRKYR